MLRRITCCLFTLMVLSTSAAWAEVLYVHDELRLGVRPQANSSDVPLAVVTTGARLEVLGRSGSFVMVRTARGVEGWVNAAYLSEDKPARLMLEELDEIHEGLQLQLVELEQRLKASQADNMRMAARIDGMIENEAAREQQIGQYREQLSQREGPWVWLYQSVLLVGLFLLGFFLGVKWYRRRISERMGGLEI